MRRITPVLLSAAMTLAGCGTAPDAGSTMALLRAGDAKVCTAYEVQETLRSAIRPKSGDGGYSVDLHAETLQSFDEAVSKASCRANLTIDGAGGTIADTTIDYFVLPTASDPNSFVVTAPTTLLRDRLAQQISVDSQARAEQAAETGERSRLAALVKPGWLIGRWVRSDQGSDACLSGPYFDFRRRNVLEGPDSEGSWKLNGFELQIITAGNAATMLITDADTMTMHLASNDGPLDDYRRCSQADVRRVVDDVARQSERDAARGRQPYPDDHGFDPNVPTL